MTLTKFLARRFPDLDLRVIEGNGKLTVRYAVPGRRGLRFPVLFTLYREGGTWRADREHDRGVIGEAIEFLTLSS